MQATTKTKRVFQLRKTGSIRNPSNTDSKLVPQSQPPSQAQQQQIQLDPRQIIKQGNNSQVSQNYNKNQSQVQTHRQDIVLASHPEIMVDQQQLHFQEKIGNVQVKNIKVKNVGSSAIYYEWRMKNLAKFNANAIKDPKPNFYCHYQPNVIKPAQQAIFSFSFFSQTPGIFVEQVQLICQPQPATPIAPIRLKGIAYIEDTLKSKRQKLVTDLIQRTTQVITKQVLTDIVSQVKSPVPPLPDVSNPQIAQKQFEQANANERLYYNSQVHRWFTNLYTDICNTNKIPQSARYWNQGVSTLAELISQVQDPVLKQSYDKRLQNYKSLSTTRPPQKSDLFPKIKQILLNTGYHLGGTVADQSKKQLEMWEIPFQEPSQTQTEQQIAAKKDEKNKIIAEWAKKMKKKKWGPEEQNQMNNNYRAKLQKGVSKALIEKLNGFDDQASFQSCKVQIKDKFDPKKYFGFLERLKTVDEFPIEGKKILLKFDLKLKQNSDQALLKLQQYLLKKKQEQLRAEQQKKNQQSSKAKKKAAPAKKKKGQKQEQQQRALTFDFNTLLDHESWQGFISTLKFIVEKQPMLLILGISYGPKTGVFTEKYSVKFLLECLKAAEPSIQFLQHKELFELKTKIDEQTLNEGSIYLIQNLSFLPCQGMQSGKIKVVEKVENGQTKKIQIVQPHKMLMSEVESQLSLLMPAIDIVVRQDRFVNRISGICSYGKKNSILGLAWWKYVAFAIRSQDGIIVLGGHFSPQKLVLVTKLSKYCREICLVGEIGVKVWMAHTGIQTFYNFKNTKNQQDFIKQFFESLKSEELIQKIKLPEDFVLAETQQNQNIKRNFSVDQVPENAQGTRVIDIGQKTCTNLQKLQNGHIFILDYPSIQKQEITSLQQICKILYTKKQAKKARHLQQQSTPAGINFERDLITYIVGIKESDLDKVQLKQKKIKKKQKQGDEQNEQEEEQQPEPEQEQQLKKVNQICDFSLNDIEFFTRILAADYSYGLKDICKYPKSD